MAMRGKRSPGSGLGRRSGRRLKGAPLLRQSQQDWLDSKLIGIDPMGERMMGGPGGGIRRGKPKNAGKKKACKGKCPPNERRDENGNVIISEDRARHMLDGDKTGGGHRGGTGKPGKSEFPKSWSDKQTLDRVAHTARYGTVDRPSWRPGEVFRQSTVNGVRIEALVGPSGAVRTAYPIAGPGVVRNPK